MVSFFGHFFWVWCNLAGTPLPGKSYFFSVGDFGVAACESAYKFNDLEEAGGIGHHACGARNQKLVAEVMDKLAKTLKPQFILSLGVGWPRKLEATPTFFDVVWD